MCLENRRYFVLSEGGGEVGREPERGRKGKGGREGEEGRRERRERRGIFLKPECTSACVGACVFALCVRRVFATVFFSGGRRLKCDCDPACAHGGMHISDVQSKKGRK